MQIINTNNKLDVKRKEKKQPIKVGFLLLENFTMLAFASAIDPLRMANQLSGKTLYQWEIVTLDGQPVRNSDFFEIIPDVKANDSTDFDIVIVAGGVNITNSYSRTEIQWLKNLNRQQITLGGICTGAYLLANAGLLDNQACSVHWECAAALQENFPKVNCNTKLYTISEKRMTSSGGYAPMDMMLSHIHDNFGHKLSEAIANMFVCDRVRDSSEQQKVPLNHFLRITQPKLIEIIELMENNIEEPLALKNLAEFVDISRRQQERLFLKYLGCTPSRYYLKIRLNKARQLLKQSTMSVIEIASACGFISAAHFSRCYRKHIGISPREEKAGINNGCKLPKRTEVPDGSDSKQIFSSVSSLHISKNEPSYASIKVQQLFPYIIKH